LSIGLDYSFLDPLAEVAATELKQRYKEISRSSNLFPSVSFVFWD
jgi:hypothetical protein